jgi:nitrite reductase/ring-hydroxylating ferredoxin subunit
VTAGARYVVARAEDLPPGSSRLVPVGKFGVGVYNVGGDYYALTNFCPHRGGPLCRGRTTGWAAPGERPWEFAWTREGEILRCPWHQWEFDIATGAAIAVHTGSRRYSIRTYPVRVENGMVVLEGV